MAGVRLASGQMVGGEEGEPRVLLTEIESSFSSVCVTF